MLKRMKTHVKGLLFIRDKFCYKNEISYEQYGIHV